MLTKLMPHQKRSLRKIEEFKGRCIEGSEMQVGKTLPVLKYLKRHPKLRPAVIICPSISKYVWKGQAREHVGLRIKILNSQAPPKKIPIVKPSILILNYEILPYWVDYLLELGIKIVIPDEAHKLKNPEAKRTKAFLRLCEGVKHIIPITGTFNINGRPIEMWNILHLLKPKIFHSRLEYAWNYCQPRMVRGQWKFDGASNLKELHKLLKKHVLIRHLKKNVLKDYKKPVRMVIPLGIKRRKEYRQADADIIEWLKRKNPTKAKRAAKAKRLVRFGYLKRLAVKLKMKNVYKWIDNYLESCNSKIVLFAIHKKTIKKLHKRYKNISVVIDGSCSARKKYLAEKTFKTHKKIRILICNIQAAGESISLSKACNESAFVEVGWTPGEHGQAEARNDGIGQTKGCVYYYLIAKGTIEEYLCEILQKKGMINSDILDGDEDLCNLKIFDELEKRLRQSRRNK